MFDNIGGKIKTLALVICAAGAIASVICGLAMFDDSFLLGLLIIVAGCLGSWTGSFCLYGFGELIEETARNREINRLILMHLQGNKEGHARGPEVRDVPVAFIREQKTEGAIRARNVAAGSSSGGWVCKACGTRNLGGDVMCKDCGLYK